ncbi:MAG: uridine kinase [Spirochaetales bacterium]|nr:uridine kinase [Spirochaetales bacterium]
MDKPKIIGISGGSGSGKTTIVRKISESIEDFVFIPQDNYYKSAEFITNSNITEFNFDHPNAFDKDLMMQHLTDLKNGKAIQMPKYDFVKHRRMDETVEVTPKKVIIFEGIMVFYEKDIRDLMDLKIFVDTPDDIRFIRRLQRDVNERGRTQESVIKQYMDVVRPGHFEFIEPTKSYADIIIPEGGMNMNALQVLSAFIKETVERK